MLFAQIITSRTLKNRSWSPNRLWHKRRKPLLHGSETTIWTLTYRLIRMLHYWRGVNTFSAFGITREHYSNNRQASLLFLFLLLILLPIFIITYYPLLLPIFIVKLTPTYEWGENILYRRSLSRDETFSPISMFLFFFFF